MYCWNFPSCPLPSPPTVVLSTTYEAGGGFKPFGETGAAFHATGRKAQRRNEVYERLSRFGQHDRHTPLGWTGRGSVGRLLASEPRGSLERIQPGQERRASDRSQRGAG